MSNFKIKTKSIVVISIVSILCIGVVILIYFLIIKKQTYSWVTGNWGICDQDNNKSRTVECKDNNGNIVNDSYCSSQTKPSGTQQCPQPQKTYSWVTGNWGICDQDNNQSRTVNCDDNNGVIVDDKYCSQPKPPITQQCPPKTYSWVTGDWSICDQNNNQSRTVECQDNSEHKVDDKYCSQPKPPITQKCPQLGPTVSAIKKIFDDLQVTDMYTLIQRSGGGDVGKGITNVDDIPQIWKGYTLDDFWQTVDLTTKLNQPLYLGNNAIEGAVIIAGMFGQFIWESGNLSICDESDWGQSCNYGPCSCGQFGSNYTKGDGYIVSPRCDLDLTMSIDASLNGNNSPNSKGEMKCAPETPSVGCCWWGRGPVQLTGRHNIKIFDNWLEDNQEYLGKLPISLCVNPGQICTPNSKTDKNGSVVWLGSLFYWINSVQIEFNDQYKSSFKTFMNYKNGNDKFANMKNTDLIGVNPVSWPSGISGAVRFGKWEDALTGEQRVCAFLRMLKLLNIMDTNSNPDQPYCDVNPNIPNPVPPHNCCSQNNGRSCINNSPWCNQNPDNCIQCTGKWYN